MIILVKEHTTLGRPPFARRIADRLQLPFPPWPISDEDMTSWQDSLSGWPEADGAFFDEIKYLDIDRLLAILMVEHADLYPKPPAGPDVERREFERWRDVNAVKAMFAHGDELMAKVRTMVDSQRHMIIAGHALGTSPKDTLPCLQIQGTYGNRPTLRIFLKLPEGAAPGSNVEHEVIINRKTFTQDEVLDMMRVNGDVIELDEAIQSARTRIPEPESLAGMVMKKS